MPQYFAFLRAINLGARKVSMERLRELFSALGLKEVQTFINTGNVMFDAPAKGVATLDRRIEARRIPPRSASPGRRPGARWAQ